MWPFSTQRTLADSGLFNGFTDCHCHILPGVDDGVETLDESLAILSRYEQLGVREVWLTPHIMEDMPNTTASLRQRFAELTAAYHGTITLHLSAENMLDSLFCERFRSGDLLPWGNRADRLLVETSYYHAPVNFHELLHGIKAKGYFPILAHPERYRYMSLTDYQALKKQGIEFQLNLFSLLGLYGATAKQKATTLLKHGLYNYIATDLHSLDTLNSSLQHKINTNTLTTISTLYK